MHDLDTAKTNNLFTNYFFKKKSTFSCSFSFIPASIVRRFNERGKNIIVSFIQI